MQRNLLFASIIAFIAVLGIISGTGKALCQTNEKPFTSLDGKPYDPATEVDVDQFIVNWQDKMPKKIRGAMLWNPILTPSDGDEFKPKAKGAVLTQIKAFSHAYLEPFTKTTPVTLSGEQEIYYIYNGTGKVTAGGKTAELRDGIGVLIPPGIEFTIENTVGNSLAMYIVTEPIPDGFKPKTEMVIRDEYKTPIAGTHVHWAHLDQPLFDKADGLAVLLGLHPVYFAAMTMGQPHSHYAGTEEVWFVVKGDGAKLLLGKQFRDFKPGTAFKIPANFKTPHSTINVTESSIKAFWMMMPTTGKSLPTGELEGRPYDPAKDSDIDMYIHSWKESLAEKTHGNLIEQAVLTQGDPLKPVKCGAVLKYVNRFSHASLYSHVSTTPVTLKGEQELFYILSGTGTLTGGGKTYDLYPGVTFLAPEALEFSMSNTGNEDMKMYLVAEKTPAGFKPVNHIVWRDENKEPFHTRTAHWVNQNKWLVRVDEGLADLELALTVTIPPGSFAQPHSHGVPVEEVWVPLTDNAYALLGKQVRQLSAGTAYLVPPDGASPHANFNISGEPLKFFYFARGWNKKE